jgi:hypothetical protein
MTSHHTRLTPYYTRLSRLFGIESEVYAHHNKCFRLILTDEGIDTSEYVAREAEFKKKYPVYYACERALEFLYECKKGFFDAAKFRSLRYYIRNLRVQSHCLSTTKCKIGRWSDLTYRIPECLFDEIIKFVEGECAFMNNMGDRTEHKRIERDKVYAANQGIDWLKFQSLPEYCTSSQANERLALIEIYRYAKYVRPVERDRIDALHYTKISEAEEKFDAMDTHYLTEIIRLRAFLWT